MEKNLKKTKKGIKVHFTRKNLIFLSSAFLWLLNNLIVCLFITPNSIFGKKNVLLKFATQVLFLPQVTSYYANWIMVALFNVFVFLFICSFVFIKRTAIYYEDKVTDKKYLIAYFVTGFISLFLWLGISFLCLYPYDGDTIKNSFIFFGEMLLMGTLCNFVLSIFIFAVASLRTNFHHIDEPYRYFNYTHEDEDAIKEEKEDKNSLLSAIDPNGELTQDFDNLNLSNIPISSSINGNGNGQVQSEVKLGDTEFVFPGLSTIDKNELEDLKVPYEKIDGLTLTSLCENFRLYLAKEKKLYYDIDTIRAFISGLGTSRFIILEGLSGTGKSSLARFFSEYISEESYFEAVQTSFRDRTSILGYFNDFSKKYSETEFLKRLYKMSYEKDDINIMVLDEVNIARIEYYFADFLSVMEYPMDKWKLKVMELPYDFKSPLHLEDGFLEIPENTWFIGTANKDDSTYTITDKVYDRAITISFDNKNIPFEVKDDVEPIRLSYSQLIELFTLSKEDDKNRLKEEDYKKFFELTDFVYSRFEIAYGNRILNQIDNFVPIYVSCGGKKEEALDFMFARKILYKLDGRLEDYIKQGLLDLKALIKKLYGEKDFKLTYRYIDSLLRKL